MSADDARRRSDEAVRRIREESRRRAAERRRVRAFSSWCALATLASGISLAALDAHDARVRQVQVEKAANQTVVRRDVRIGNTCTERVGRFAAITNEMLEQLRWAASDAERARVRDEAVARKAAVIHAALLDGCDGP